MKVDSQASIKYWAIYELQLMENVPIWRYVGITGRNHSPLLDELPTLDKFNKPLRHTRDRTVRYRDFDESHILNLIYH